MAFIIRHSDGGLQMTCGGYDHPADCSDFEVVNCDHITERQPDTTIANRLVPGELAEFENGRWVLARHDD